MLKLTGQKAQLVRALKEQADRAQTDLRRALIMATPDDDGMYQFNFETLAFEPVKEETNAEDE